MQGTGGIKKPAYLPVAGFGADSAGCSVVVAVTVVFPASLLGDGFEHLGSGSPTLLGRLCQIAASQFLSGLREKTLAGLLVLLGGHWGSLLLPLQVSNSDVLGQ